MPAVRTKGVVPAGKAKRPTVNPLVQMVMLGLICEKLLTLSSS